MTRIIPGLRAVADGYDVLLCDIWGVIHNGREAFPAACAALARWRKSQGPVVLISNAPRPRADVAAIIHRLGVPRAAWSAIVTSGDASREVLAARAPGPVWRIGPPKDDALYEGLGLTYAGPEEAAFIACSGPEDEERETPESYRERLAVAAARGLTMVCANPDQVVQRGDRLIYCAGALARLYEELGGAVIEVGKPFAAIYDLALAHAGGDVARRRVLAIGDGVRTDLGGAVAQGLDALFVAGGIHAAEALGGDGRLDPRALAHLLGEPGPAFAIEALTW